MAEPAATLSPTYGRGNPVSDLNFDSRLRAGLAKFCAWLAPTGGDRAWHTVMADSSYPGGSKERVRRAGNNVRKNEATIEDFQVIDLWRAAHRPVLNTFQAILRTRTRGTGIVVAQRHKRRKTIYDKLDRLKSMQLHRMDDVAGCRLIFDTCKELYDFREKFHKARFGHKLRNDEDKYDYIKNPKITGYRGVHDVYEYNVNSVANMKSNGLYIEVQYRTRFQHAWATCVEVIGFITDNQPKFEQGDRRYREILAISSEIIARAYENSVYNYAECSDDELVKKFLDLDDNIGFMSLLRGLNKTGNKDDLSKNKNVILIFQEGKALEVQSFRDATEALRALFALEKTSAGKDIVLVRADTSEEIRIAFKNYFSDATEFIELIDEGCQFLSGKDIRKIGNLDAFGPFRG